jgi:hypothetical protein
MCVYKCTTYGYRLEFIKWWCGRKEVPQCRFTEGVAEEDGIVYRRQVVRVSPEPYSFVYTPQTGKITGIACVPVDAETQSPEAEVIAGGIHYNYVTLRLTPVEEGRWACDVVICIKPPPTEKVTVRQLLGLRTVLL